jgi:NADH dehydrogenase FAD-containing subunit
LTRTVVVVGGGYGGSLVAKALDPVADVVLVDPRDAFVNASGSLRALTQPDFAPNVFFPFDALLHHGRVVRDLAVSVDPGGVTLASGDRLTADILVLATGSGYPYPAKPSATTTSEALDHLRETHKALAGADRVLILGAGPVGLELSGEIKEVWPHKHVTVVDRGPRLLPEMLPEVRTDLHRQLDALGVQLRLGTTLLEPPATAPGQTGRFTVTTATGTVIEADIWFRAYGVSLNTAYLTDGKLVSLTERATVPVTEHLNVTGYRHVYALGDIVGLPDPKMASYAQTQAEVVVRNVKAQLLGEPPEAAYVPSPERRILLPLGPRGGVGQLPTPDGVRAAPMETVIARKGADLFTARFATRFHRTAT